MWQSFNLVKVNEWNEEIEFIPKEFQSEEEAWTYLRDVLKVKSRKGWQVQFSTNVPAEVMSGKERADCVWVIG